MNTSIESLLEQGKKLLLPCSDSAKLDAQILLCFVLNKERSYLLTWPEKKLNEQQVNTFVELLSRRTNGEPIAYIVGIKEFWSLPFYVSPATLIPRPDTETLIEVVLEQFGEQPLLRCLDLGTGTGAIALALASELNDWRIDAVDFNEDAVTLAKKNAHNLNLTHVNIYQSDWFSRIEAGKQFHLIVSNPPYIDINDEHLALGDVRFEPESALLAHDKGLADIKHITTVAHRYLAIGGALFFEHGYEQGLPVRTILEKAGYINVVTVKDLNGHDRITWGVLSANQ
jgi:release factor glutamine methyltransferase